MKIIQFEVTNFGSYKHLALNLEDVGLGLLYGPTGAGKSTVLDIPCWVLFGRTAKDGSVDEIRSWQSSGDAPTTGSLRVVVRGEVVSVLRVRGSASQNDLYFTKGDDATKIRGKNITETQQLLETALGVTLDRYMAAAYFSEFSPAQRFFRASAKDRKRLPEQIADLSFSAQLAEVTSARRKELSKEITAAEKRRDSLSQAIDAAQARITLYTKKSEVWQAQQVSAAAVQERKAADWARKHQEQINAIAHQVEAWLPSQRDFAAERAELEAQLVAAGAPCPTCGVSGNSSALKAQLQLLDAEERADKQSTATVRRHQDQLRALLAEENPYLTPPEVTQEDPFEALRFQAVQDYETNTHAAAAAEEHLGTLNKEDCALDILSDLSTELRAILLTNVVREIETLTNYYLETYFEAALRASFEATGNSVEVVLQKDGYECSYEQLSKGQRQLLKLTFALAVMKTASNASGVQFHNLFLDEALDGFDADLKAKAFALFTELSTEHDSVLLVEHEPSFQNLFTRRYRVSADNGYSALEVENE